MKDFLWLKSYPKGIPAEINPDEFDSLLDIFDQSMQEFQDRPAFENMGVSITYGQLDKLSRDFAAYLQQKGFQKGDRMP